MKNKFIIILSLAVMVLCVGCTPAASNNSEKAKKEILTNLETKYGINFTFQEWDKKGVAKKAYLTCPALPGKTITAERKKENGKTVFTDDYMVYKYEDEIKESVTNSIMKVYPFSKVIVSFSESNYPDNITRSSSAKDILQNPDTDISIVTIVKGASNSLLKNYEADTLRTVLKNEKIRAHGDVYYTDDDDAYNTINETTYKDWAKKKKWIDDHYEFKMNTEYEFDKLDWGK